MPPKYQRMALVWVDYDIYGSKTAAAIEPLGSSHL